MEENKKKYLRAVVILAAGIAITWLIIVSRPAPEPEPHQESPPHLADVAPVNLESRPIRVTSQGSVKAKTAIDITSQVSGEVVSVGEHFAAGGFFTEREVLLRLDPRDFEIALTRSEAALAEARNLLAQEQGLVLQAKKEWRELGSPAANDLFLRKPQLAAANANVKAAQAGVRKAQLDLERTSISLPFSGRVIEVNANLGQYINSGSTLGSVYASSVMEVRLPLTATELSLLNLQAMTATHELSPLKVSLSFVAGTKVFRWQAKVVRLESNVDIKSRLFYLIAEVDNELIENGQSTGVSRIMPGTFVDAVITSNPHEDVVSLPRSALYQNDQVLYLDDENRLRLQQVTVLQVDATTLVVKGLANGQQVLFQPPSFMELGEIYTPVSPVNTVDAR